jgi:cell pole-organizing protein PopZ
MNQNDIDALLAAPGKEADDEADVLELTQPAEPAAVNSFRPVSGADVAFREERSERTEPAPAPAPAPAQAIAPAPIPNRAPPMTQAMTQDELLSPASTAAVSAAFGSLASTILSENARTLEDLVQEMMRPMLKDWLDENLPGLVERMVRAEIERVSRGGR